MSYGPIISVMICELPLRCFALVLTSTAVHQNDFGKHIYVLPNPAKNTMTFLKILYAYRVLYYAAVSSVKASM